MHSFGTDGHIHIAYNHALSNEAPLTVTQMRTQTILWQEVTPEKLGKRPKTPSGQ